MMYSVYSWRDTDVPYILTWTGVFNSLFWHVPPPLPPYFGAARLEIAMAWTDSSGPAGPSL